MEFTYKISDCKLRSKKSKIKRAQYKFDNQFYFLRQQSFHHQLANLMQDRLTFNQVNLTILII